MAFADKIENGMIGKLRNGKLVTYMWVNNKLCEIRDGSLYSVDRTTFFFTEDARRYTFRKTLSDVMAIYKPEFSNSGFPLSPEEIVRTTDPIWVREPAALTESEWRKLREDKEVLVSSDGIHWLKRNFRYWANGTVYTYPNGRNKWTGKDREAEEWKYGRLPQ